MPQLICDHRTHQLVPPLLGAAVGTAAYIIATRLLGAQRPQSKFGIPAGLGLLSAVVVYRLSKFDDVQHVATWHSPFPRHLAKVELSIGQKRIVLTASYHDADLSSLVSTHSGSAEPNWEALRELHRFKKDETRPYAVVEGRPLFLSKNDLDALAEFCEFEKRETGQALVLTDQLAHYYDADGNELQKMLTPKEVAMQTWDAKSKPMPAVRSIKLEPKGSKPWQIKADNDSNSAIVVHSRYVNISPEDLDKLIACCEFKSTKPSVLRIHTNSVETLVATCMCTDNGKSTRETKKLTDLGVELEFVGEDA